MKREVNCRIFRCGVIKNTNQPIPPHAPKIVCDQLALTGQIYGCGKPFRLNLNNEPEICDYI
jgi:hypothetical protein